VQSITGTGTAQTQQSVNLTWDASADAVGYNVYRGTVSGGPYTMINASLHSTTTYTDNTVVSGQTYYYVTTAVNSQSQQSGYSNQTTAVVPNP
jgi:fibronectin type 3 domain-containing protein